MPIPFSLTEQIPVYLTPYIAKQDPSLYTAIDQAVWRFIMKVSQAYYAKHAHQKYLTGLVQTGISTERIPLIEEMDHCLRKFNWRAVPVVGFIPPAVFMEFLSLGILPIACDIRTLEHLAYTPAPDIVHEAAGHAPIVADPEYASYLRSYGEISRKAIFSREDMEVYQAIRNLSDTKENPSSTAADIQNAQERLNRAVAQQSYISEANYLARMGWWTFEYGLVGSLADPKIYGAGLLSSVGESHHCFDKTVSKIPFSIQCIEMSYDITRPQPQLYVARDFQELINALEELGNQMAFRRGGIEGLEKAIQAETVTTVQLDSGVQISGQLVEYKKNQQGEAIYIRFSGPTQIAYKDQEIYGQGADYHNEGFSSPLMDFSEAELRAMSRQRNESVQWDLGSGIFLKGHLLDVVSRQGIPILFTFDDCTVTHKEDKKETFLFRPEWGKFDWVCGKKIVSVFGGAADRQHYLEATGGYQQEPYRQKTNLTPQNRALNDLYAKVRKLRESHAINRKTMTSELNEIYTQLQEKYPHDWLLRYELLELSNKHKNNHLQQDLTLQLLTIADEGEQPVKELIQLGLDLC